MKGGLDTVSGPTEERLFCVACPAGHDISGTWVRRETERSERHGRELEERAGRVGGVARRRDGRGPEEGGATVATWAEIVRKVKQGGGAKKRGGGRSSANVGGAAFLPRRERGAQ